MKISIFYLYASSAAQESARSEPRVYWQLSKMMTSFNPDFSSRKFWLYGCNCVMLGNNQLSDPGYGPPVDALDTACKRHKDCLSFGLKFQYLFKRELKMIFELQKYMIKLFLIFKVDNFDWKVTPDGLCEDLVV